MKPLLAVLLLAGGLHAAGDAYASIVRQVEAAYHVKPLRVPFQKGAGMAGMVATPFGMRGLRLAIFEDLPANREPLRITPPGAGWQLVIRSESEGERVRIYARPEEARIRVLVVSDEDDEIAVVESEVTPAEFARQLGKEASGGGFDEP